MELHGLQKMTLLDFPGHVACTVFLGGCDFRCPFCHNYELVDGTAKPVMGEDELLEFLVKRRGLLDGVAFTGGEPCLHDDLPDLVEKIRSYGYAVKLDTNGAHPALLRRMLEHGLLDYVAMDVKNSPEKYPMTCGVSSLRLDSITESISLLMEGKTDYEFRTTVVAEFHDASDFFKMGEMIRGAKRWFLQCFTDRNTVPFGNLHAPTIEDLKAFREIAAQYVNECSLRGVD